MAVELVLLAPAVVAILLLVVAFGRYVAVRGDIEATARDAAREASLQASADQARAAALDVVDASLETSSRCAPAQVLGDWAPDGEVRVVLTCRVDYSDLGLVGLPGSLSVDADSAVPLDPYRSYR
ncbi:TadE family protein [Nocardioides bruguierae]|uniref:Pilus assembly protein n=1 Tax=Nocardioides bruguierae TaxID=2945102 RepID=A0A9X2D8U1_9ACTN|nr:TadE family protein [Nocardioides bruguierae]MCM0621271.1 pilus assembly protein [Nocardioides bruguierae]